MKNLLVLAIATSSLLSCDADLETGCRDGTCLPEIPQGGNGGGDAPRICETPRGFPADVCHVLENNCHRCHGGLGPGPFALLHHCDAQADFFGTVIHQRMKKAVNAGPDDFPKMPLDAFPLAPDDLAILNAWFATCEAGACATGDGPLCAEPEGGGGAGGAATGGGALVGGAGGAGG